MSMERSYGAKCEWCRVPGKSATPPGSCEHHYGRSIAVGAAQLYVSQVALDL